MEWEALVIEWMQTNMAGVSRVISGVFDFIGGEEGLICLILIVMFCWDKNVGKKISVTVLSVNIWFPMLKAVVLRPRPYYTYPDRIKPFDLVNEGASATNVAAQGYSFPSTHSGSVVAAFFSLARYIKKTWIYIIAIAFTIMVGVSRVAAGMHYPTDVLSGWCLGFVVIFINELLEKFLPKKWQHQLIIILLTLPGVFYVRTADYYTSLGFLIGAVIAFNFEEKYVDYSSTKNIFAMVLRVAGAFVIYILLNSLLKLPFDKAFLDSDVLSAFMVRCLRYAIIGFVMMGIYPMVFPFFEKIGKKK